uniref:DNA-directed RNA polymerase subunit n=1 Tax=Lotharella vacuolata TaxID=74820 RepID=A0A140JZW6_9EUKA|nr:RNA polymerase gamma subunit [Lotharella vacuolata]BAU62643.1 RNA polymerase gamma subunit [Lotharella vacuolata]
MNNYYIENLRDFEINLIQIKIASPKSIIEWGSRVASSGEILGEVKTPQTVNYRTLRPEKNGLFCEHIFGPINDFQCACGNKYENELSSVCEECGLEFESSKVRRYRLGYIKLISPVVHILYIRYISLLLDIPFQYINSLIYCTNDVIIKRVFQKQEIAFDSVNQNLFLLTDVLNNNNLSHVINFKYSLQIQTNIIHYLKFFKTSFFLSTIPFENKKIKFFEYFSFLLNNFYALSYSFKWEAKKQWRIITFYLRYKNKKDVAFLNIVPLSNKGITKDIITGYEEKVVFGTRVIYNWLRLFDYNFQLSNLERQVKFHFFEIKEEILELSYFIYGNYFKAKGIWEYRRKFRYFNFRKYKIFQRLKLIQYFRQAKIQPRWMILSVLPVLPPDLRPIIQIGSNTVAVADLNKLYQTILLRNIRLEKFYKLIAFDDFAGEISFTKRLLQESIDDLIRQKDPNGNNTKPIKSLLDNLKGKRGRFRQNLLGKRVDYSGRAVIVVDPSLHLHQCGLPLKIIVELFSPFLIQCILSSKYSNTIPGAKKIIEIGGKTLLTVINVVLKEHLILLNRAPTLHKLGIQAFQPKLVKGNAIRLHPLVCPAFNADFDGDQMGIHIPLFFEARAEAWKLLWSRNNILFSATGMPILTPGQDMILGCYYLTSLVEGIFPEFYKNSRRNHKSRNKILYFKTMNAVLKAYNQEKLMIHTNIWIKWRFNILTDDDLSYPDEIRIYKNGNFCLKYSNLESFYDVYGLKIGQFLRTTVGRVIFNYLFKLIAT